MLNILSAFYVAVATLMISNDADSIAKYQAEREQLATAQAEARAEAVVSKVEDELWMN